MHNQKITIERRVQIKYPAPGLQKSKILPQHLESKHTKTCNNYTIWFQVISAPSAESTIPRAPSEATQFRKYYERGDLPIALEHDTKGNKIAWKVEIEKLDYHHYLPLFFDGLKNTKHPYSFFACQVCMSKFYR